jgi:hypothetical protein
MKIVVLCTAPLEQVKEVTKKLVRFYKTASFVLWTRHDLSSLAAEIRNPLKVIPIAEKGLFRLNKANRHKLKQLQQENADRVYLIYNNEGGQGYLHIEILALLINHANCYGITPRGIHRKLGILTAFHWVQRPFLHDLRVSKLTQPLILLCRVCPEEQFGDVYQALKKRFVKPRIIVLASEEISVKPETMEQCNEWWLFTGRFLRVWNFFPELLLRTRKKQFDLIVVPMNNSWGQSYFHCKIFALLCGAKFREAYLPCGGGRKINGWVFALRDIPWSLAHCTFGRVLLAPILFIAFIMLRCVNRRAKWLRPDDSEQEVRLGA